MKLAYIPISRRTDKENVVLYKIEDKIQSQKEWNPVISSKMNGIEGTHAHWNIPDKEIQVHHVLSHMCKGKYIDLEI